LGIQLENICESEYIQESICGLKYEERAGPNLIKCSPSNNLWYIFSRKSRLSKIQFQE